MTAHKCERFSHGIPLHELSMLEIDIDNETIIRHAYSDTKETQLVKNDQVCFLLFKSQQVLYEKNGEMNGEGWDLICIALEVVYGERVFRRTGILVLRDEHGRGKGLVEQIRNAATVHEIVLV